MIPLSDMSFENIFSQPVAEILNFVVTSCSVFWQKFVFLPNSVQLVYKRQRNFPQRQSQASRISTDKQICPPFFCVSKPYRLRHPGGEGPATLVFYSLPAQCVTLGPAAYARAESLLPGRRLHCQEIPKSAAHALEFEKHTTTNRPTWKNVHFHRRKREGTSELVDSDCWNILAMPGPGGLPQRRFTMTHVLGWAGLDWNCFWGSCRQQCKSTWTIREWPTRLCSPSSCSPGQPCPPSLRGYVPERMSRHLSPVLTDGMVDSFLLRNLLALHSILAALYTRVSKLPLILECLASFLLGNYSSPIPCGSSGLSVRAPNSPCFSGVCLALGLDVQRPPWVCVYSVFPSTFLFA